MNTGNPHIRKFDPVEVLKALLNGNHSLRRVKTVGRRLADIIARDDPFSASYLYNVIAGKEVGAPLEDALRAAWLAKQGVRPPYAASTETVLVRAIAGRVEQGTFITAKSKTCLNPLCMANFLPVTSNQRYCSSECRREHYAVKRRR